jgi:hypothetical protein
MDGRAMRVAVDQPRAPVARKARSTASGFTSMMVGIVRSRVRLAAGARRAGELRRASSGKDRKRSLPAVWRTMLRSCW